MNDPLHDLLFPKLSPEDLACLHDYGTELHFDIGERLFSEGDLGSDGIYVLLNGKVRVTKRVADGETTLVTHEAGQFTGEIGLFTEERVMATARAMTPVTALKIPIQVLKELLLRCPTFSSIILPALIHRRPEAMAVVHQREKLAALGKLSAGLAHELNNPAAAMSRAASQMREVLNRLSEAVNTSTSKDSPMALAYSQIRSAALTRPSVRLDPMTQSDREGELADWLEERGVAEAWNPASTLVSFGLTPVDLAPLNHGFNGNEFPAILARLEADLAAVRMIEEIEEAATRISSIVKAVKSYSYMDRAAVQEINIHDGIESTLTIFAHELKKGIRVVRDFDPQIPPITASAGELNQVWTNLIDNALDAMGVTGTLTVRTRLDDDTVMVEIADDGPGIPPEIQSRIFEPFYTTKPVGDGSGLGLDIVCRIVKGHGGDIRFVSGPGDTRFMVLLPVNP